MSESPMEIERRGPVLWAWLNRPEKRNALDTRALEEIAELFAGLATDYETRVAVLAGRGPSFCAGADRSDPPGSARMVADSGASERERRYTSQIGLRACRAIEDAEVVTIARVHGHAVGGGVALALACDLRVADRSATFRVPEVDLGLPLTWGATARLIHEVGAARAREIILLCDSIDATRAESLGIVHRVVATEDLDAAVSGWAKRIAEKPEAAVHRVKTQMRAHAAAARQGDTTESDGDLLLGASRSAAARASFRSR